MGKSKEHAFDVGAVERGGNNLSRLKNDMDRVVTWIVGLIPDF